MEESRISDKEIYKVEFDEKDNKITLDIKKMLFVALPLVGLLLIILIILIIVTSRTPGIEKRRYQINVGDTIKIKTKALKEKLTFTSLNKKVATVDKEGKIKALSEGFAKIIVKYKNAKTETTMVEVRNIHEIFKFKDSKIDMYLNQKVKIEVLGNYKSPINWISSDRNIVEVNDGIVTAKAIGTAFVTGKTLNGKEATLTINVSNNKENELSNFYVSPVSITFYTKNPKLDIRTFPENIKVNFTYKVKNENILKIDSNGNITPIDYGTTEIIITSSNGLSKVITAEVK